MSPIPHHLVIAYELQARYAAGEPWVTLRVGRSNALATEAALHHRDAWGRKPTDIRVIAVRPRLAAA